MDTRDVELWRGGSGSASSHESEVQSALSESVHGFEDVDASVFMRAAALVSSGYVAGPAVATLMDRLVLRLEVAMSVGQVRNKAVAERAYAMMVEEAEIRLGVKGPPVRTVVEEIEMVVKLFGRSGAVPRGAMLPEVGFSSRGCVIVGSGAVAIPLLSEHPVAVQPEPEQLVLPACVYRAVLQLDVSTAGEPSVRCELLADGSRVFVSKDSPTTAVAFHDLPSGLYELPGGYGVLVSSDVMCTILATVWANPSLEKESGFCYLRTVPLLQKDSVREALRTYPTVGSLCDVCPEVLTWSPVEAKVTPYNDPERGLVYHVESIGRLPDGLPFDALLGGYDNSSAVGMPYVPPKHYESLFADFEAKLGVGSPSVSAASDGRYAMSGYPPVVDHDPMRPVSPPATVWSTSQSRPPLSGVHLQTPGLGMPYHQRSRSVSDGYAGGGMMSPPRQEGVLARTGTPVFHLKPGVLATAQPVWDDYPDARAREWHNRLDAGPPIGATSMSELSSAKIGCLPPVPYAEGGRIVAVPAVSNVGVTMAGWRAAPCPIPGWSFERIQSVRTSQVCIVPPAMDVICRYEVSADGSFMVNGVSMSGHRSAFWATGCVLMSHLPKRATVWRAWRAVGAAALGFDCMALHLSYQMPAVLPARRDRNRTICARLIAGDAARGEESYRASCDAEPGESMVHIYVSDNVVSECAVVGVSSPSLTSITVHGAVIAASGGQAWCITDLSMLRIEYNIAAMRRSPRGEKVTFEIRRTLHSGDRRAKVQPLKITEY